MANARAIQHSGTLPRQRRGLLGGLLQALYEYAALYSSLLLLGLICLSWSLLALPLYVILPAAVARRFGRYGIMRGFRCTLLFIQCDRSTRRRSRRLPTRDRNS